MDNEIDRITILLGAGAMIEATGVTTQVITEDIKCITDKFTKTKFIELLYDEMCKYYNDKSVNFEDIFDALETLDSLESVYSTSTSKLNKPIFGLFTTLKEEFKEKLKPISVYSEVIEVIKHICCIVHEYDLNFGVAEWFNNFFIELSNLKQSINKKISCDIYNLNYDTWLENIFYGHYNDGFELYDNEIDVFNPQKAISFQDKILINHLHGQIYFGYAPQNVPYSLICKYKKYEKAEFSRDKGFINSRNTQSRESIFVSPIITGLRKTDKTLMPPFDTYRANLQQSILRNNKLIIVGYGFGDVYINSLLNQFFDVHGEKGKVIIIDKVKESVWENSWGDLINTNFTIPHAEKKFIYSTLRKGDSWRNYRKQKFPYKVKLDRAIWYMDGFKAAATNDISEIIQFIYH